MKKLQNNFTTPEQSKRLVELGVPADSADMYYCRMKHEDFDLPKVIWESYSKSSATHPYVFIYFPCWSVGRLIEIITICREEIYTRLLFSRVDDHTNIENLIHYISEEIKNGHIEFSKLEE